MLSVEEASAISLEHTAQLPSVDNLICTLQHCRKKRDPAYAKNLHLHLCNHGLEGFPVLSNHLVPIYVDCGNMPIAHQVFNGLAHHNEFSWTSLLQGHVVYGESQHALDLFQEMQKDCVQPSSHTYVALIKACVRLKSVEKGRQIHYTIAVEGYEGDLYVGTTLVDMYAKCGSLVEAHQMFDLLPVRDVVSWNTLIAAYVEYGHGEEALNCLEQMKGEGISPDAITIVCSLKSCGMLGALNKGRQIHAGMANEVERDSSVCGILVDMYIECGSLVEAREAFDKLPMQDVVSWTALMTGYVEHGQGDGVLICLEQMQMEGLSPNALTYVCILKACGSIRALNRGREIHAQIIKAGFEEASLVGNTLVDMYAKCGSLAEAQGMLDSVSLRDVVSWSALIAGYAEYGLVEDVLDCLEQMQQEGISPNGVTFVFSLKACGSTRALDRGLEIHTDIVEDGFENDPFVCISLVDMYAKFGLFSEAREMFNMLQSQGVVSWTALVAGYAEYGLGEEALDCLEQMQLGGVSPDPVLVSCCLKACASIEALGRGQEVHAVIVKMGFERDPFVGNTLVDMYAKCGSFADASEVLDKMLVKDAIPWNALIAGYVERELAKEALNCLEQMRMKGVSLDPVTCFCSLKACGSVQATGWGRELHAEIAKKGFERNYLVGNTLVDMYAKCGCVTEAQQLFGELTVRDVVSWNTLISGYAEHELGEEALNCFQQMQVEGLSPDAITLACGLKACGSVGAIHKGREIHAEIAKKGFGREGHAGITPMDMNTECGAKICAQLSRVGGPEATAVILSSALVDMYGKCGSMVDAQHVFDAMLSRNQVTWTALITGYTRQGKSRLVFYLFEEMTGEDIQPDEITFLSVLAACNHAGCLDKGKEYYEAMTEVHGITPSIEHQNCMVDLLGRAGQLDEAVVMLDKMHVQPDLVTWITLLGACCKWGNVEIGRHAFESAVRLDRGNEAVFRLMSNIYGDAHLWEEMKTVEARRASMLAEKETWTEIDGALAGCTRHPQSKDLSSNLDYQLILCE